jgi:N-acetylmuramoyl-L-alanine amidase
VTIARSPRPSARRSTRHSARRSARAALLLAILTSVAPAWGAGSGGRITIVYPDPRPADVIMPIALGPVRYLSTNDLARVFGATKFWRPEIRKLTLRIGDHNLKLTVDAPIVLIDEQSRYLVQAPRLVQGIVYVPETLLGELFQEGILPDAVWDDQLRTIRFRAPVHGVRQAQLWARGRVTEVSATLLRAVSPRVLYATPSEVRVLFDGGTLDTARVFSGGLVSSGSIEETPDGVELRLHLGENAKGYSVSSGGSRLKVAVTDDKDLVSAGLFNELAPVSLGGPDGKLRTIVIDPGHGGKDAGVSMPGGFLEKDVALEIARALRNELGQRLGARVILTREGDSDVTLTRRAEIANEAQADLFVSLHLDAEGALRAGGFRVLTLSATAGGESDTHVPIGGEGDRDGNRAAAELVPWRTAQLHEAGTSMAVGQAIADALGRSFPQSPVVTRCGRVSVLDPILCPAVLIEAAPSPRSGPESMSLRGYTIQEIARTVAQAIRDLAKGEGA